MYAYSTKIEELKKIIHICNMKQFLRNANTVSFRSLPFTKIFPIKCAHLITMHNKCFDCIAYSWTSTRIMKSAHTFFFVISLKFTYNFPSMSFAARQHARIGPKRGQNLFVHTQNVENNTAPIFDDENIYNKFINDQAICFCMKLIIVVHSNKYRYSKFKSTSTTIQFQCHPSRTMREKK